MGALHDDDDRVGSQAAQALAAIGKDAVPPLRKVLKDTQENVLVRASLALGRIGPDAKEAVPELKELLSDVDDGVKRAAAEAIKRIDPKALPKE
jgi:HEAT repeat protein